VKRLLSTLVLGLVLAGVCGGRLDVADAKPKKKADLAVIVHPDNPVGDIGLANLAAIFRKERRSWPSGGRVIPLNWNPRTPPRVGFDLAVLRMTPDEAAAFWIDQRIRGRGDPPRSVGSAATIQAIVSHQTEAISYVPLDQVGAGVKVLTVGGVAPGREGYPIPATSKAD
jgi:hypothetical protein